MQTLLNAERLNCLAAAWSGGGVKSASSRQVPGIGGVAESGFRIDGSCANKFFNVTIEMLHSLVVFTSHSVKQSLAFGFAFFHVLTRA
jgi:hypothetical protein